MLIDTHAHLHVPEFENDREEVIKRARAKRVDFLSVGFEPAGNVAAAELASRFNTYWTAGIHPHHANEVTPESIDQIEDLAQKKYGKGIVAIGECGLDYVKNHQPRATQLIAFAEQLRLAKKMGLPVIIHGREAFEDIFLLLEREKIERAVFHCFTGTHVQAKTAWNRGYYTSFTGILTYPSAQPLRNIVQTAPIDRLMIESDCPYLAPQSKRAQRNEPAFIPEIAECIARERKREFVEIEAQLYANTLEFFGMQT